MRWPRGRRADRQLAAMPRSSKMPANATSEPCGRAALRGCGIRVHRGLADLAQEPDRRVLPSIPMAVEADAPAREVISIAAWAVIGALLAAALLAFLSATGHVSLRRTPAKPADSEAGSLRAAAGCPLRTSSPMCDACMKERCSQSCAVCADDPDCIALFLCVLDCREPACSRACSDRYPGAAQALEAFAGEHGCMRKCRDACR